MRLTNPTARDMTEDYGLFAKLLALQHGIFYLPQNKICHELGSVCL